MANKVAALRMPSRTTRGPVCLARCNAAGRTGRSGSPARTTHTRLLVVGGCPVETAGHVCLAPTSRELASVQRARLLLVGGLEERPGAGRGFVFRQLAILGGVEHFHERLGEKVAGTESAGRAALGETAGRAKAHAGGHITLALPRQLR